MERNDSFWMNKLKLGLVAALVALTAAPVLANTNRRLEAIDLRVGPGGGILTFPNTTDTLVGKATTDVLTNKTISGASNTLSNIGDAALSTPYVKADGTRGLSGNWNAGAFNITATTFIGAVTGNASTATALAADPADCGAGTKAIAINASGTLTCSSVDLSADTAATALPIAKGGTNGTSQTAGFNNLSPVTTKGDLIVRDSTNNVRHAVPADYGRMVPDSGATDGWRTVTYAQTENGKPTKSYIQYADFENNATTGWTATGCATVTSGYPNCPGSGAAAFSSSNGGRTKGANTSAPAIDSASSVSGTYALSLATTGAGTIGDGYVSSLYAIDPSDRGATFSYRIAYKQASGAPVAGGTATDTYAVSFYDAANNTFLTPSNPFCFTNTTKGFCTGYVNTSTTTTGLQAFVYSPIAPVGASSLLLDDFYLGTSILPTGPPTTDATAFTPNGSWVSGTSTYTGWYWRDGDKLSMRVKIAQSGAPTATTLTVNLPSGLTIDTTKLPATPANHMFPGVVSGQAAAHNFIGGILYLSTTAVQPVTTQDGFTTSFQQIGLINATVPYTFAASDFVYFEVHGIPIVGWTSNVTMLSSTSTVPTFSVATTHSHTGGFSANSTGTYTPPAGVKWIKVHAIGAGGSGSGSGTAAAGNGADGASSTFGSSLITAGPGIKGSWQGIGGAGGSFTINSPASDTGDSVNGQQGSYGGVNGTAAAQLTGGPGGSSCNGGGPAGGATGGPGGNPGAGAVDSGGGGGGAGTGNTSTSWSGSGGGAGACAVAAISNPSASYSFTVGAHSGAGGAAGTNGAQGGQAADGRIWVEEFYTPNPNVAVDSPYVSMGTEGAGTTTLTNASQRNIITTLSAARTYTLPSGGIKAGDQFTITNTADFALTLQSSGANTIAVLNVGTISVIANVNTPTAKADWTVDRFLSKTTVASTWTFNGSGGTSGSVNMVLQRNKEMVNIYIPGPVATSGTSSTQFIANTNLPSAFLPASQIVFPYNSARNNGGAVGGAGAVFLNTSGTLTLVRDTGSTAFTNSSSCGFQDNFVGTYYLAL